MAKRTAQKKASPLYQFLKALQTDADLEARYREDPLGTMKAAGLSAEERAAMKAGPEAVGRRLGARMVAMTAMTGIVGLGAR